MEAPFASFGGGVEGWRSRHQNFLQSARAVFAPTESAATPIREHFKLSNVVVKSHPHGNKMIMTPKSSERSDVIGADGMIRIAVIGAIGQSKGYSLLKDCIVDAELRELPLLFQIVGHTEDDASLLPFENVRISGRYSPGQGPEIIRQSGAGIALFLSPWPETWSYTLSEALEEGLFPVSLDIGAIAERMRALNTGQLLPVKVTAAEVNDALVALGEAEPGKRLRVLPKADPYQSVLKQYFGFGLSKEGIIKPRSKSQRTRSQRRFSEGVSA
jgi:glycosyltransferase involved in cell wall biosynthesis